MASVHILLEYLLYSKQLGKGFEWQVVLGLSSGFHGNFYGLLRPSSHYSGVRGQEVVCSLKAYC